MKFLASIVERGGAAAIALGRRYTDYYRLPIGIDVEVSIERTGDDLMLVCRIPNVPPTVEEASDNANPT